MVQHMMHTDKVKLWWNGKEIPADRWRKADWTYQMRPRPKRYRGYRLHVDLRGEDLPKMGRNTIRVDVLKKDSKLVFPIVISDVGAGGGVPARPERVASGRRRPRIVTEAPLRIFLL